MNLSELLKFTPSQKATYAEVNTGTDDEKYITPEAIADSTYIKDTITYAKIDDDLKSSAVISATDIDWSSAGVFTKTLSGNIIFTFSNLQLNKVITVILTGDYVITWPAYMDADHLISGEYDGTTTNYIQIHCTDTNEVWWTIKTVGA